MEEKRNEITVTLYYNSEIAKKLAVQRGPSSLRSGLKRIALQPS